MDIENLNEIKDRKVFNNSGGGNCLFLSAMGAFLHPAVISKNESEFEEKYFQLFKTKQGWKKYYDNFRLYDNLDYQNQTTNLGQLFRENIVTFLRENSYYYENIDNKEAILLDFAENNKYLANMRQIKILPLRSMKQEIVNELQNNSNALKRSDLIEKFNITNDNHKKQELLVDLEELKNSEIIFENKAQQFYMIKSYNAEVKVIKQKLINELQSSNKPLSVNDLIENLNFVKKEDDDKRHNLSKILAEFKNSEIISENKNRQFSLIKSNKLETRYFKQEIIYELQNNSGTLTTKDLIMKLNISTPNQQQELLTELEALKKSKIIFENKAQQFYMIKNDLPILENMDKYFLEMEKEGVQGGYLELLALQDYLGTNITVINNNFNADEINNRSYTLEKRYQEEIVLRRSLINKKFNQYHYEYYGQNFKTEVTTAKEETKQVNEKLQTKLTAAETVKEETDQTKEKRELLTELSNTNTPTCDDDFVEEENSFAETITNNAAENTSDDFTVNSDSLTSNYMDDSSYGYDKPNFIAENNNIEQSLVFFLQAKNFEEKIKQILFPALKNNFINKENHDGIIAIYEKEYWFENIVNRQYFIEKSLFELNSQDALWERKGNLNFSWSQVPDTTIFDTIANSQNENEPFTLYNEAEQSTENFIEELAWESTTTNIDEIIAQENKQAENVGKPTMRRAIASPN